MSKLDEKKIIEIFQKRLVGDFVGEDVEIFHLGKNFGVIKTDTLVQSTDVPPQMSPEQIARKSIVAPLSDFASKGVKPKHGIISVSLPKNYPKTKLVRLAKGFQTTSKLFGVKILGGDTNEAKEIVISVMLFGIAKKIIPRGGAKLGDVIITTGNFGKTSAGLSILLNKKKSQGKFKKNSIESVLLPKPRLEFGVLASKYLNSSMDSSDGLSTTLTEMAKSSKKKFIITHIPKEDGLDEFAKINHKNVTDLVFNGGEEYEIVATVPSKNIPSLKKIAKKCKINLIQIGHVKNGSGVFLETDKTVRIRDKGWKHFRN
ncbi:MAG: thiamine-phosphate kinase [Nitrososphaeria archaeon]|nr:thiamine-phosphate kinase [Nitrososphaeria archaeon]NDB51562.1 thiamine-phosphate kinase [Nitrosopumilaceae archaeon]NDB87582.1 thiamine-phosphate kinase [Nitrososphaerota archaeon]NDB45798.1 thiamine-phosphate kinase [Nitrososphaeria archaeon]NDB62292.1 thiamine-phosphate kinase [Nitrosopumilaceae archaeon]